MQLHLKHASGRETLTVAPNAADLVVQREGHVAVAPSLVRAGADEIVLDLEGVRHRVRFWRDGPALYLHLRGEVLRVELEDPDNAVAADATGQDPVLRAPMPGKVLAVLASEGMAVDVGDPLVRMEAMKMEIDVVATSNGTVARIAVAEGDLVEPDAELLRIDPEGAEGAEG